MSEFNPNDDKSLKEFYQKVEEMTKQLNVDTYNNSHPELDRLLQPQKLVECRHEIVFNITANVMEEDDEGTVIGTVNICRKDYHIPVPANKDYNVYMSAFFKYLEECIANSAKICNENSQEKSDE
jgi:hypothetical protein